MDTSYRTCRVCGKRYKSCQSPSYDGVFRWQQVACCPEHGAEFLREVRIARGEIAAGNDSTGAEDAQETSTEAEEDSTDEIDELFEEDADDEDDESEAEIYV